MFSILNRALSWVITSFGNKFCLKKRSRLIKTLDNRFYVKFMQLEIGLLSVKNIVRYFYTCTVLKLAIMIFVHFPSDLTKLLPNYVFLDCIKISEKKIYNSNRQVT